MNFLYKDFPVHFLHFLYKEIPWEAYPMSCWLRLEKVALWWQAPTVDDVLALTLESCKYYNFDLRSVCWGFLLTCLMVNNVVVRSCVCFGSVCQVFSSADIKNVHVHCLNAVWSFLMEMDPLKLVILNTRCDPRRSLTKVIQVWSFEFWYCFGPCSEHSELQ
jgi:hypothetical protein